MKKGLLLSILVFALSFQAYSQADDILATVEWSSPMPKTYVNIVYSDSARIYYAGRVSSGFTKYDEIFGRMRVEDLEKELEITKEFEKIESAYPVSLGYKVKGEELHGFYTHYDKKKDLKSILVRKIIDENRKSGDFKVIGSIESSRSYKSSIDCKWSQNDSILMLVGSPEKESGDDNEAMEFQVLDHNYDLLYQARIELDFEDRFFSVVSQGVTNSGKILMLGYKTPNRKKGEKKKKESNETYYLYVYDQVSEELIEYDLGLKDKFITNIALKTDFEGNKTVLFGMYSDENRYTLTGTFYISIDQSNYEISNKKFNPFDQNFIELMTSKRGSKKKLDKGKKKQIESRSMHLRNFIIKENGGHLVVFENYDKWETASTFNKTYRTNLHYRYNEVFVQNYSPEGDVIWTAFIPKYQQTTNDGGMYSGYLLVVDQNKLHFIYNDHKKNEALWGNKKKDQKVNKGFSKANLVMVTLTEGGDLSYNVLMKTKIEKFMISPRLSRMLGKNSNSGILFARKESASRLGRIELILE